MSFLKSLINVNTIFNNLNRETIRAGFDCLKSGNYQGFKDGLSLLLRSSGSLEPFRLENVPFAVAQIPSLDAYQQHVESQRDAHASIASYERSLLPPNSMDFNIGGHCYICRSKVDFLATFQNGFVINGVAVPNWRETLLCPRCRLNNRMRATIHIFDTLCQPRSNASIYITEQMTPLYEVLAKRHPHLVGSEFLGAAIPHGQRDRNGIRNEDLTRLSFGDGTFDFILSFDVLEHIPDYRKALSECCRSLKPGGAFLFSVPFITPYQHNTVRASLLENGEVQHLLPPEYHGDPISAGGCLCFYHFGWDLLAELKTAGFADAQALLYWSKEFGYLGGEQIMFMARKG